MSNDMFCMGFDVGAFPLHYPTTTVLYRRGTSSTNMPAVERARVLGVTRFCG